MATVPKIKLPLLMLKLMMKYEYLKKNPENIARERALLVMFNTSEDVKQRICDAWRADKHDERLKNREDKEDEQEKRDEQEGKDGGEEESGEPPAKKSKRNESSSGSSDRETTESQLQRISSEESDEVVPEDDASDYGDRQSFEGVLGEEEAPGARMLHSEEPEQSPYDFQEGSSEGSTPNPMHPRSYSESGQPEGSPALLGGAYHSSNAPTPEKQTSPAEESSAEASTPEESTASSDGSATPSEESPVEVSTPDEPATPPEESDDPWKNYQIFPSDTPAHVIKVISESLNENRAREWYYPFQRKDDNNIRKRDDSTKDKAIFKLLFNRKVAGHSEGLEFVEFPIDTIKIVIGYGKISIQVNPEEPAEENRLELAFLHHDDGLLMWENGEARLVERSTYYDFAASYAKTLMQFPKQPIKNMIFDIEPYTNGPKVYPDYNKFYKKFEELEGARWKKIKVVNLSLKICRGPKLKDDQFHNVTKLFQAKYMKLITLTVWDDSNVIADMEQRDYKTDLDDMLYSPSTGLNQGWGRTVLDINDERIERDVWEKWVNFKSVKLDVLEHDNCKALVKHFLETEETPRKDFVVCATQEKIHMDTLKNVLLEQTKDRCRKIVDDGFVFDSNSLMNIRMDLYKNKLRINCEYKQ